MSFKLVHRSIIIDQIERELQRTEEVIKSMFNDVQVLRDNRYNQANELHRRYVGDDAAPPLVSLILILFA